MEIPKFPLAESFMFSKLSECILSFAEKHNEVQYYMLSILKQFTPHESPGPRVPPQLKLLVLQYLWWSEVYG